MKYFMPSILIFMIFLNNSLFAMHINEKQWIIFVKKYYGEYFYVNFPKDPTIIKNLGEKGFLVKTEDSNIRYSVEVTPRDESYFEMMLRLIQNNKNIRIVDYSFSKYKEKEIFDVTYQTDDNSTFNKVREILTQKNIYTLHTSYKIGDKEEHDYFISSFSSEA